ncbi:phospholipase D family protein [Arenibacter palladensis]|uniref:phospholipase D family protein n=1 Tax=Arenibacter palladensis TaxID=237373 RepID=UPI002FD278D2
MSSFLTGKELESKLTDIIWHAKKYIIIISPFIKLDDHIKKVLERVKSAHKIRLYILFGKNEEYKYKSFNEDDFKFISDFKNVTILYNKNLHAKHYCNESEGLITSLNLYGYSMVNNVEYGVHFSNTLNPLDQLYQETEKYTNELLFELSELVFLKKPQYQKVMLGLHREYQQSEIIFDVSEEFFNGKNYESKKLGEIDLELETSIENKFHKKPQREEALPKEVEKTTFVDDSFNQNNISHRGFCIRTGEKISFNQSRPFSYNAFLSWNKFGDENYQENYCHYTGEPSNGQTSYAKPILGKNWRKAKAHFNF